ncbi:6-phosphogluconolactonase [Nitrosomonas aestuarii]|uniref:6-phosphogluconolactonase n=1 Tax=Nitrosomonas aestuarii TaxID=52441 RepID=A0A1I4AVP2_9PROT|nr:6-phosphogluconolactonase [Nitrosomonas aestuarii]SFK60535.1 6-phosphogluconolactonase [Nitrosomonas aestuarii]
MERNYCTDIEELAYSFADYAAAVLSNALKSQKAVSLVVPGGNTPRFYLPALAAKSLPWNRITVTLSDERWVDTKSEGSNEYLVRKYLLAHLPEHVEDQAQFIGLKTRHDTPAEAIPEIQQRLKQIPQPFTLTVLGLGEDGHIASLFPGLKLHEKYEERNEQLSFAVYPPLAPSSRVSLSLEALASSGHVILVVTGKNKRHLLDNLTEHPDPKIPLVWLLQHTQAPVVVFETDQP